MIYRLLFLCLRRSKVYTRYKLTLANRVTIPVGAVVELEVNEVIEIPNGALGTQQRNYGTFHIRKKHAMKGLFQAVSSPFGEGWVGKPTVVVQNRDVTEFELLESEEIGELWLFGE